MNCMCCSNFSGYIKSSSNPETKRINVQFEKRAHIALCRMNIWHDGICFFLFWQADHLTCTYAIMPVLACASTHTCTWHTHTATLIPSQKAITESCILHIQMSSVVPAFTDKYTKCLCASVCVCVCVSERDLCFINALHVCVHEINHAHKQVWEKFLWTGMCIVKSWCVWLCAVEGRAAGLNKSLVERIFMKREVNTTWERKRERGECDSDVLNDK